MTRTNNRDNYRKVDIPHGLPEMLDFDVVSVSNVPSAIRSKIEEDAERLLFYGVIPELALAWVSVDSTLFLWPADPE